MGKRGPAPRGEYAGKSKVMSTRIRADTRDWLERAAAKSGRSLSQEIEHRLRGSFNDDELTFQTFGSRRNYALMRIIAMIMEAVFNPDRPGVDWVDDPYSFDQVVKAVNSVLDAMRPPGAVPQLSELQQMAFGERQGSFRAGKILLDVQQADGSGALDSTSKRERRLAKLKDDLGPLAQRPVIINPHAEVAKPKRPKGGRKQ